MAGDWIKMRTNLDTHPKVIEMAAILDVDELHVVGLLWKVWSWADSHTLDGNAINVTSVTLDRFTRLSGFADALRKVGWLEGRDNALTFPRFAEHNGQTAKKRAETADRVAKHRARSPEKCNASKVTDVTQKVLPEKRREEKRREEECVPPPPLQENRENPNAQSSDILSPNGCDPPKGAGKLESELLQIWNAKYGFSQCRKLSPGRLKHLKARLSDSWWKENWREGLEKAARSSFCTGKIPGRGGSAWNANIDWFLRPDTLAKILEGKYDDKNGNEYTDGKF